MAQRYTFGRPCSLHALIMAEASIVVVMHSVPGVVVVLQGHIALNLDCVTALKTQVEAFFRVA